MKRKSLLLLVLLSTLGWSAVLLTFVWLASQNPGLIVAPEVEKREPQRLPEPRESRHELLPGRSHQFTESGWRDALRAWPIGVQAHRIRTLGPDREERGLDLVSELRQRPLLVRLGR